jgi:DNA-binding transcriptional regulator YiaG
MSIPHTIITTPSGEKLALLRIADLHALQDALDAATATRKLGELARGEEELLTSEEVDALLAAPTPLAFWRRKRGLTQAQLATALGVAQSYVATMESGARKGTSARLKVMARVLRIPMERLVAD